MSRCALFLLTALLLSQQCLLAAPLEIRPGDHISIIGNTQAERMQLPGHNHFETLLYQHLPAAKSPEGVTVRNLSWSADEVVLRPRAEGFGTPDEHLTFSKTDVVIAFFGFNESFKGEAGLPGFKKDLEAWIQHTKAQNYSGKGAPRIALVSPLAAQDSNFLQKEPLPHLLAINDRLALYTTAMKEVAEQQGVAFADVFTPSLAYYKEHKDTPTTFTINGVHLSPTGDAATAPLLYQQLFSDTPLTVSDNSDSRPESRFPRPLYHLTLLREIEDKNQLWYNRYRIVDSYYVYGGRSGLKFADGEQTNRDVMQREREVLDVMVANRDARIHKLAQGQAVAEKADDSNVPPFLPVQTSFGVNQKKDAGKNTGQTSKTAEGASAQIPSVADTLKTLTTAKGFKVECFASEENFPELANATAMAFDSKGRLWVCTMPSYPQWRPGDEFTDKIIILEDSDGDGKANYCKVFADKLHLPISFEFHQGGVLVSGQRDLLFLRDTDGDGVADFREVLLSGFDSADSHHVINSFTKGPGGDLYFQEGTFHHSQMETPYGPVRCLNAGTYRYEPRTQKLSVFASYNYANPHGIAFDKWGQNFIADASGGMNYFGTAFSGYLPYPEKHAAMQPFFPKRVRPTSGCEFVSSRNFPDEMQGNFLLNNCIGVQGVLNHQVKAVGSGFEGKEIEPLLLGSDPNFRPVDMEFAPDGSLYIVDWSEALIGHMQYSLRDPLRDKKYGRIWRIWNTEKPLLTPAKIDGASIDELIALLKAPEYRTRERAKYELSLRPAAEVIQALDTKAYDFSEDASVNDHFMTEALWVQQMLDVVNADWLREQLTLTTPEARAAGVRVLCYWRDRIPDALELLKAASSDPSPLVRLEAVRACSFFAEAPELTGVAGNGAHRQAAANIALQVLKQPMDYYLEYTLAETMRALKPAAADLDLKTNPAALSYVLGQMSNDELKAAPREKAVLAALLERQGIDALTRDAAATDLAKLNHTSRELELASALMRLDDQQVDTPVSAELGKLLASSTPEALRTAQEKITRLAVKDHGVRSARVAGMAAYVVMIGDPAKVWQERQDNHETLSVWFDSLPLIPDPAKRAAFQPYALRAAQSKLPAVVRGPAIAALALTGSDHAQENFAALAKLALVGEYRSSVARTALQLPRTAWDTAQAQPVAESLLAYAKTVPAGQRSAQDYVEITQFGIALASLIPNQGGDALRDALQDLGVSVFVITAVREQMRYNNTELAVAAGKPFEVIFENADIMPHNIVFVDPGTHLEVGAKAMTLPATPNAQGYLYIPDHPAVWKNGYSHMLEPGQKERLQLTAPEKPGNYEYVCTFPGHSLIMWGTLKVTAKK